MKPRKRKDPPLLQEFKRRFPRVWEQHAQLREACDRQGPLSPLECELIKVGISAALRRQGGLIAHVDRARDTGASEEQIYQAILLTTSLAGLPTALAAFGIAKEHLEGSRKAARG